MRVRLCGVRDDGDLFYVVESGAVGVTIRGEHIRPLAAGDSFGEVAHLRDVPRPVTVTATSDLVVRTVERDQFLSAVTHHGRASDEAAAVVTRLLAVH